MTVFHEFLESTNPRKAGRCACGRPANEHPDLSVQPDPTIRWRNIRAEREITREAARGYVDPEPLIDFSEARVARCSGEYVDDPNLVRMRDWLRDSKEELADCRFYLTQLVYENAGTELGTRAFEALRGLVIIYDGLGRED